MITRPVWRHMITVIRHINDIQELLTRLIKSRPLSYFVFCSCDVIVARFLYQSKCDVFLLDLSNFFFSEHQTLTRQIDRLYNCLHPVRRITVRFIIYINGFVPRGNFSAY